ncbi:MAG: hypothetical protein K9L68_12010, partial [Spirochaetales bacterium]|nr:hypothetical protein [Spirochaetales bacterium]MCF7939315.1 hypothetical protein [Spirochaetales bacterium]
EEAPEKAEETPPTELTGEPVEVEEVSEATGEEEEIEELEEPEELEEFESGEETVVAGEEPEEAEAPEEPEGTEEPEAAGEPEEPEELEEAEELEAAGEPEEPEELEEAEEIEEAGSEEETPEEAEEATIQIEEPPEEPEAEELEEVTEETLEEAVDEEVPVEPEPEELEEIEDIEPLEEGEEEVENVEELEEAEDIEDSGQSEGVVEELEAEAGGPLGAFGYNPNQYNISFRQTQFDSTVEGAGMYKGEDEEYEEVESLEEIEELEDLSTTDQGSEREGEETEIEELEELEELEEQKASDTGPTVKRIDDLKQMGKIVSISLREFQLMVNEGGRETTETKSEEPVQEKNGVFSIRDDVFYRDQAGESDQGFAELVDSVLGNEDSEKQEDDETPESNKNAEKGIQASQSGQEDFESVGGIESLFGDETGEDLLFSDEQESEEKTGRESSSLEVGPGPLVDKEGLHFDLLVGKDPERETKIIKALIRFSRVFDGLFSAILEQTDKNLICRYSVGLNEESRNNLVIWKKEELFRDYLEERAAVIINWPLSNIQEMKEKVSEKDRGSIDCILLLPLIYKRNAGYVMVGSNKQSLEGSAIAEALRQWKTDRR